MQIVYSAKITKELSKLTPKKISLQDLSNQRNDSDLVYNLTQVVNNIYNNAELASLLKQLITRGPKENIRKDITTLYGSGYGRAECYKNLDQFAKNILTEDYDGRHVKIGFTTDEDWKENTNSVTQEFLSYADKFAMYFYQWNNRWFLSNGNCAHRIAAIYRQAKEQNRLFELTCKSEQFYIDLRILHKLQNNYHCFVISCNQNKLYALNNFLFEIDRKNLLINITGNQNFTNCQGYAYCFLKKNTWFEKVVFSYFDKLETNDRAIDLVKLMSNSGIWV